MIRTQQILVRRITACVAFVFFGLAALSLVIPSTPFAFSIKPNKSTNLDGKVLVSPAAERITTMQADGGDPIAPGKQVIRPLLVQNRSEKTADFDLDVAQVVGSNAEDIVEVRHGVRQGSAAWVTLERQTLTLKPGDTATVLVTIAIPKLVKPGSKAFAVTVTQRGAQVQTKGAGVTPIFRQIAIYIVDLPGDAPIKGKIVSARVTSDEDTLRAVRGEKPRTKGFFLGEQHLSFSLTYKNSGDRLLTPEGSVQVKDLIGREVARYNIKRFTVYPEGENAIQFEMKKLPMFGILRAHVVLESDAGKQSHTLGWIIVAPKWALYVLAALLLVIAFKTVRWFMHRRKVAKWADGLDDAELEDEEWYDDENDDDDEGSIVSA